MPDPPPPPRRRALPLISTRCTGCGRCVGACDAHVLWLDVHAGRKAAVLHDRAGCTGCARCVPVCPVGAVSMARPARSAA